jgi:LDH2 family malate/lactate/ureidoglycolate dehydrogenase
MDSSVRVSPDHLRSFAAAVYERANVPADDARLVADALVQADLWGHQSHGVMRTGWYLARIHAGRMNAVTEPEFVVDRGAVALIDGHDGIGQVLTRRAMQEAVTRAKLHGIGAVGVRNSNHFGTAMYYTRMAAAQGCIGFLSTNASPAMAPWGGAEKTVGTNPWSWAAPAGRHPPMVADIANTGVARGKIYLARQRGESIPLGWAINAQGAPTTDPAEAIDGIILPMAGHKGYVIAAMMDVLSGVLTGSGVGTEVHGPNQAEHASRSGHLALALDVSVFQPLAEFNERMEKLIAQIKSVPRAKGVEEIFYPGEVEVRNEQRNCAAGIELPADTLADLRRIARDSGLESMLPF